METKQEEQVKVESDSERKYWCTHAFRILPHSLLERSKNDFGQCTFILGADIAVFNGVRFRDCEIPLGLCDSTTLLIFAFPETPNAVFCILPEEIVVMDTLPLTGGENAKVSLGFVPRPEIQNIYGILYENSLNAEQLAQAVSENGPIKLTLCGVSQGLLKYFHDLQQWKREMEEKFAAASRAQAEAAAVNKQKLAAIQRIAITKDPSSMSGSLPTLRPRGMDSDTSYLMLRKTVVIKSDDDPSLKCHMRELSQETMKDEDSGSSSSNPSTTTEKLEEQCPAVADTSGEELLNPVPIPAARMPGLESLVKAASIIAPSPLVTPPLFLMPSCLSTETNSANAPPAQPIPMQPSAASQFYSPFSGITPGLRTPDLDEEAVAVLQRGITMKRRKSNSEKPIIPYVSLPIETTPPQPPVRTSPVRTGGGAERKAGRFKIPPEQRHKRSYSQGGHSSGSHTPSSNGAGGCGGIGGGLSSFCGTQDGGGGQGLHQCKWEGCNLTFGVLSVLTTHLQSHTLASSDFVCRWDGCPRQGKPFSNHSGLFRHLRYHTGDKPCKCPIEGCSFSSVDNGELNRHIKLVHRG